EKSINSDEDLQDSLYNWSVCSWYLVEVCFLGMSIGVIAGSRIRLSRLILFGPSTEFSKANPGRWLSFPAALLLRLAGLFGLMESLLVLAYWASSYVVAEWMRINRPIVFQRIDLIPMIVAFLYF